MTIINVFALLTLLFGFAVFYICVYVIQSVWVRTLMLGFFVALTVSLWHTYFHLTGSPRNVTLSNVLYTEEIGRFQIHNVIFNEPESIFLWITPIGESQPIYLSVPWDDDLAQMLNEMMQEQRRSQQPMYMDMEELLEDEEEDGEAAPESDTELDTEGEEQATPGDQVPVRPKRQPWEERAYTPANEATAMWGYF